MFASVTSVALVGVEPRPVRVEVHVAGATRKLSIVGLPDASVREAKERVQAAILSSGYKVPPRTIVVNLSPADLPKVGSAYDLPIALGVLAATGQIEMGTAAVVALGELALDGAVRPVVGALGAALVAADLGVRCVLPVGVGGVGRVLDRVDLAVAGSLVEAVAAVRGEDTGHRLDSEPMRRAAPVDLAEVRGQARARRGLEIAAAGGHHLLMSGAPGAGKTMLARALPGLLPPLDADEVLEVALAWGAAGLVHDDDIPPFRAPHHSATPAALIGGGSGVPVPGEITLAHRGVLFLDELGEYPTMVLDALRQPFEEGSVVVARKGASVRFPCRFQLVAATNPCPCGYLNDALEGCNCNEHARERYTRRFSGPLLDRFDLRVVVDRLDVSELAAPPSEPSADVRLRVKAARKRQQGRGSLNASLGRERLDAQQWSPAAQRALMRSVRSAKLTARGWDRVRRVAVTIADLDESGIIGQIHVDEALTYRALPATAGVVARLPENPGTRSGKQVPRAQVAGSPVRIQPVPTQPAGTQPAGTQPAGTQPAGTQPAGTQPAGTQPAGTNGAGTGTAGKHAAGRQGPE